jgi:hypothetical protein
MDLSNISNISNILAPTLTWPHLQYQALSVFGIFGAAHIWWRGDFWRKAQQGSRDLI